MELDIYTKWYDNFKDYSTLEFITKELDYIKHVDNHERENRVKRLFAVVSDLNFQDNLKKILIEQEPGKDYHLYKLIIGDKPQPIPELKHYSLDIQNKLNKNPCWIEWAAIYDRKLTDNHRQILGRYRKAYIVFMIANDDTRSRGILELARKPYSLNLITFDYLYSIYILRKILNK